MVKSSILDIARLDVSSLTSGIYVIEFVDSDGIKISAKFIKI
jgi:hypothetical protein